MFDKILKKTLSSVFFIGYLIASPAIFALPKSCPTLAQLQNSALGQAKINTAIIDWLPDGDTIHTKNGGRLRLLHINTPEINATNKKPAEAYAISAKKRLRSLIGESAKIWWISDRKIKDRYGRDLALVFNHSGILINAQLVSEGLATTLVIPPNLRYWQCISEAAIDARAKQLKLWSEPAFQAKSVAKIEPNQGFQLVSGVITQIQNSAKHRWLVLDDGLWVGIARKDFEFFKSEQLKFKAGQRMTLTGYVYRSHAKLRVKLRHPSMLLD